MQELTSEEVLSLAEQLTPGQELHPIEASVPDLEEPLQRAEGAEKPLRSLYGRLAAFARRAKPTLSR